MYEIMLDNLILTPNLVFRAFETQCWIRFSKPLRKQDLIPNMVSGNFEHVTFRFEPRPSLAAPFCKGCSGTKNPKSCKRVPGNDLLKHAISIRFDLHFLLCCFELEFQFQIGTGYLFWFRSSVSDCVRAFKGSFNRTLYQFPQFRFRSPQKNLRYPLGTVENSTSISNSISISRKARSHTLVQINPKSWRGMAQAVQVHIAPANST